jgi:hypothetical protein
MALYGWLAGQLTPGVIYSFTDFFAIFAAIGLKLRVLLYGQELLFQFAFRCD